MNLNSCGVLFSYMDIDCVAVREQYRHSKVTALRIVAADTQNNRSLGLQKGESIATATIEIESPMVGPEEIAVKTYSENSGLLPVLIQAKIVTHTNKVIDTVYGMLPVVSINSDKLAEL